MVIKSSKPVASTANRICYTFSAVVIKFIAETDLWIAIAVQATTNFIGCYIAMWFCDWILSRKKGIDLKREENQRRLQDEKRSNQAHKMFERVFYGPETVDYKDITDKETQVKGVDAIFTYNGQTYHCDAHSP